MEIRKSEMRRPNLSWRSIVVSVGKKTNRRDHPGGCLLSNALLAERGRRRRFHQHPRERWGAGALARGIPFPCRLSLGTPEGRGDRKLYLDYRCPRPVEVAGNLLRNYGLVFSSFDSIPAARVLRISFFIRSRSPAGPISSSVCHASAA